MSGIVAKAVDFTPKRKANPFDGVIADAVDLPEGKATEVTIPKEIALSTAQTKIREAAKDAKFRTRIRSVDEENRVITFTLHPLKASDADTSDDEATETSVEG